MEILGKVLWWSERDQNGIIVDPKGNEYYFDRSVLKFKDEKKLQRNSIVLFEVTSKIKCCRCATNVKLPSLNKTNHLERRFQEQSVAGL